MLRVCGTSGSLVRRRGPFYFVLLARKYAM